MIASAIAFVAGAWSVSWLPALPAIGWLSVALPLALAAWFWRGARPAAAAALGFALAIVAAHGRLEASSSPALAGDRDVVLVGEVSGLPDVGARRVRFRLDVAEASLDGRSVAVPDSVRLSWYGDERVVPGPGERWRLSARLRAPRGSRNPGAFDYERWLFREGIGATGYVRGEPVAQRLAPAWAPLARARGMLWRRLVELTRGHEHAGILRALAVGDRDAIDATTWDRLIATGTNHLVAISGLHIGLLAGAGFALGAPLWRFAAPLRRRWPRPVCQAVCALGLATLYAGLAGFALPTQRALIMLGVGLGAILWRRRARPAEGIALAAIAVVAFDPLAPMGSAFWLSFGAVASILYLVAGRLGRPRRLAGWVRLQLAIGVALLRVLVVAVGHAPVMSPLVNLLAVPWVSLAVVPPTLTGAALAPLWPGAAAVALGVADAALTPLALLLQGAEGLEIARVQRASPPPALAAISAVGAAALLAPRGIPGRLAALAMLAPLVLWSPPRPQEGAVWLDVLDVGQGLAVVVRTREHTLVYDTGPRFSPRFDAGEAMVVPFLRQAGTDSVDALVVSHAHDDHAGGLDSVAAVYPPQRVLSGEPHRLDRPSRFCAAGDAWTWDGVRFRFVHPTRSDGFVGNNASCVLRISSAGGTALLTGDIETPAERALVERGGPVDADVVVAPHHGSATSSTPALVERVDPTWVLYSVGWSNQWAMPADAVVGRWRPAGFARTDCGGALHLRLRPRSGVAAPQAYRERRRRFWHAGCDGAGTSGTMQAVSRPGAAAQTGE